MGHVFDFEDARGYDGWFEKPKHRYALDLELKLIMDLANPQKGQRLLDIGCGTGISLVPFLGRGMNLTGIDASGYMLDYAAKRLGNQVDLHRGMAEELPFDDNAFDTAVIFTSLEFTDRPAKAIEEACRVARDQVIIGVLNRYAPLNLGRRVKCFFAPDIYSHAHFFSIGELKTMMFSILGQVPVKWQTVLQMPLFWGRWPGMIEDFSLVKKSYFGTLIGMRIKPVPKFRTRPLALKISKRKIYKPAAGLIRGMQAQKTGGESQ